MTSGACVFNIGDNGNVAPTRSISAQTGFAFRSRVWTIGDELFVADASSNKVAVLTGQWRRGAEARHHRRHDRPELPATMSRQTQGLFPCNGRQKAMHSTAPAPITV